MIDSQVSLHGISILLVSSFTTLHFFESSTLSATLLASIMMHVLAWLASFLEANFGIWASVIEELVSSSLTSLIAPSAVDHPYRESHQHTSHPIKCISTLSIFVVFNIFEVIKM